jgi:hypothetical protein
MLASGYRIGMVQAAVAGVALRLGRMLRLVGVAVVRVRQRMSRLGAVLPQHIQQSHSRRDVRAPVYALVVCYCPVHCSIKRCKNGILL